MNNKKKIIFGIILGIMLGLVITTTYAIFSYNKVGENQQLITGDIYMHYKENNTLVLENQLPSSTYDETKYFEFTVDGKNTNTKYDIYYDINIGRGDKVENKNTQIEDKFIKFTLLEKIGNGEFTPVVENMSYPDFSEGMRIWKNTILKNTNTEVVNTYRLYMWISDNVVIGNDTNADYDIDTWNSDIFASIKVTVTGDFQDKELYENTLNAKIFNEFNNNATYIKSYNKTVISNNPTFTTQDTVGVNNNKQDVLYYTGSDALEHGNVLFAGYCWQIVRTTDTGAIKLIYNGVAVDNKCETSRSSITFKGINASESQVSARATDMTSASVYGRSYDYDLATGMFTLTETEGLPPSWSASTYKQLIGTYTCMSGETTCNEIYYVGHYQSATSASAAKYKIGDVASYTQLGTSYYNAYYDSPALVGYMYNDVYRYMGGSTTAPSGTFVNSVTWDDTNMKYILGNDTATTLDTTHHYICDDETCTKVRYYYCIFTYNSTNDYYYVLLENGKTIENALKEMVNYKQNSSELNENVNVYSSAIKGYLDNWYKKNIFGTQSENYIDKNTAYCNDRSVSDLGGWNSNGTSLSGAGGYLKFKQYTVNQNLSCENVTDRMSAANVDAKLTYPVGLITEPERGLMGQEYVVTGQHYWGASPNVFTNGAANVRFVSSSGDSAVTNPSNARGARPVISLRSDSLVTEGNGGYTTPYVVGPIVTRDNTNYNY